MQPTSVHVHRVWSLPLSEFLQSLPSEAQLRSEVLPKVGESWRAVCTFLSISNETVEKKFTEHIGKVDETLFSLLCMWRGGKEASWGALLQALRAAKLNAQANCLLKWGKSGGASVSCMVVMGRDACTVCAAVRAVNAGEVW